MRLIDASRIAEEIKAALDPYCNRIEIAGSIRRECCEVGDVEIVCIPSVELGGLFKDEELRSQGFCKQINAWEKVKGSPEGKYTQRIYEGMKVDIFIAVPENWGMILAIRTGSADFSHMRLAARWAKFGYTSRGGILYDDQDQPTMIREEKDLFDLLGLDWLDPKDRDWK